MLEAPAVVVLILVRLKIINFMELLQLRVKVDQLAEEIAGIHFLLLILGHQRTI